MTIVTRLEPQQVLEHIARVWPNELAAVPGQEPGSASGTQSFRGQYITRHRAAVRVTMHGSISAREGRLVHIALEAEPYPVGFLVFSSAALLLPVLALMVDAVEPRQALLWWLAGASLFGAVQWIVAGVTIGRLSKTLTKDLASQP